MLHPLRNIFNEQVPLALFMIFSIFMGIYIVAAIATGNPSAAIAIAIIYVVLSISGNYMLGHI